MHLKNFIVITPQCRIGLPLGDNGHSSKYPQIKKKMGQRLRFPDPCNWTVRRHISLLSLAIQTEAFKIKLVIYVIICKHLCLY